MSFFTILSVIFALFAFNYVRVFVCACYTLICNAFFVKCSSKGGNASEKSDADNEGMENPDSSQAKLIEKLHSNKIGKLETLEKELRNSKRNMDNPTKINDKAQQIKETKDEI